MSGVKTRIKGQLESVDIGRGGSCGLTAVDDSEFLRVGRPVEVVNGSLLVESDSALEATSKSNQVEVGLSVVRLVGLIDVGGGEEKSLGVDRARLASRRIRRVSRATTTARLEE